MAVGPSHFPSRRTPHSITPRIQSPASSFHSRTHPGSLNRRSTRRRDLPPPSLSSEFEGPVTTAEKCRHFFRKVVAFVFSHVGLIVLVIGYAIGGALIFQAVEGPHEDKESSVKAFSIVRNMTLDDLWSITTSLNVFSQDLWSDKVEERLHRFQNHLVYRVREDGYDGTLSSQWTFSGSFLFALTVITTIGKIGTILYAIFGIPLMLLYLTNIGGILAQAFRFVYGRFCLCSNRRTIQDQQRSLRLMRSQSARVNRQRSMTTGGGINRGTISTPASPTPYRERMPPISSPTSSLPQQRLLSSTPPPLHFPSPPPPLPDSSYSMEGHSPYATLLHGQQHPLFGQQPSSLQQIPPGANPNVHPFTPAFGPTSGFQPSPPPPIFPQTEYPWFTPSPSIYPQSPSLPHSNLLENRQPSTRQAFASTAAAVTAIVAPTTAKNLALASTQKVHVPISLCLMILITYVSGGGFLFSIWEEDWGYLEGSYFCFISLSTIGFGDLVPGNAVVSGEGGSQERLIICSLYLLAGLALIAMCFNLMQEEVIHKIRNCGRNIGIIRDPEMEEDDEDEDEDEENDEEASFTHPVQRTYDSIHSPIPYMT